MPTVLWLLYLFLAFKVSVLFPSGWQRGQNVEDVTGGFYHLALRCTHHFPPYSILWDSVIWEARECGPGKRRTEILCPAFCKNPVYKNWEKKMVKDTFQPHRKKLLWNERNPPPEIDQRSKRGTGTGSQLCLEQKPMT